MLSIAVLSNISLLMLDSIHRVHDLLSVGFTGFQPKKRGTYTVEVVQDTNKFPGSPFQIQVGDGELCTASKVKASGAIREGMSNQWNEIVINVGEAGNFVSTIQLFYFKSHIKAYFNHT